MEKLPITRTKIILPRRPASLLSRPRLFDLFDSLLDYRLVLVIAPAGYGKTSLLLDLAHQIELPVCWYALDALDHDPQRFMMHLIASIAQQFPEFGQESRAAVQGINTADPDLDRLVETIVNEAYEQIREHFFLILDDYHLVNENQTINRFVSQFIQKADENCHLLLSSRTLLTLPDLPLMVARSQVGGLDFEELAFRADEIQALALQNDHLTMPKSVAIELAQVTEGWITGLLLSTQTMWQGMADRVRVARASGVGLYDYLAEQVLDQQEARVYDFLLRTSLLEEFDAELCALVLGPGEDWQGLMDAVLQSNLFVLPVENGGIWLRYHHLFRDFLQARLTQERPDEKTRLLQRLATVYADQQEWEKAHKAYQRLGDLAATADLIERAGAPMVKNGRLNLLAEWLDALAPEVLGSHPGLLSVRGDVAVMLGQVSRGLAWLDQAETALRAANDLPRLARTLVRRTVAHRFLGQYQASLNDADAALALAEQDKSLLPVQAGALRAKGLSLYQMGQLNAAAEWFGRSLAAYTSLDDEQSAALLFSELGLVYMSTGRCNLALEHYQRALAYWQQTGNLVRQATVFNNLGVLHHLKGDYEQAVLYLDQALGAARKSGFTRMRAVALAGIGDLYADLAAPKSAGDAYRQAHEMALELNDRFLLRYLALVEAALARREGDLAQAQRRLEAIRPLIEESDSGYEQGMWQLEAGRLALAGGEFPAAVPRLIEAIHHFDDGGQQDENARAHLHLATAYHSTGELKAAQTHLEQAFQLAAKLESQHSLVLAGQDARTVLEWRQDAPANGRQASELLRQVAQFERKIPTLRRRLRRGTSAVRSAPPQLTIQALGQAQVMQDGMPIKSPEWQSRKIVRDLFFLLLARPDGLTKESIGVIFWPDISPSQLKLRFKNAIYRLRRALGHDVVQFDDQVYRFNRTLDYEYDVERFLVKLEQAQAASDPAEQARAYREAVYQYGGSYLPELDGTWVLPKREALRQAYCEAVMKLADYHLQTAEYELALDFCRRVLGEDPCLEEAHRLAMRAHAAGGNRSAVARQFELCRQLLQEEIGASPSPQTRALYETLTR